MSLQLLYFASSTASAQIQTARNDEINGKWEQNKDSRNACLSQTKWLKLCKTNFVSISLSLYQIVGTAGQK